ncbi:hypothetical protein [Falsiroseomonas sp.]|uniref:hypothetical protein n=1 Tax=Falsiroseomonas sp. TaxID=2870721 RepID=UPI00273427CC|nr:hypothetical protein [Falsiroseomonas sp.]MDP3414914.1 hypothetical protein [Falsiroseomonas sp.]
MARWVRVGPAVAEAHPLHGMGGWLRLPSLLMVVAVLGCPFLLVQDWQPRDAPHALLLNLDLLVSIGLTLAAAVLWFRRWHLFRLAYAWVFLVLDSALQLAAMAFAPGLRSAADPAEAMAEFLAGLAFMLPLAIAMQHSRRFRVTFERRLRAAEVPRNPPAALPGAPPFTPPVTPPAASHSPGRPPAPSY